MRAASSSRKLLADPSVICSMNGSGNVWDDPTMASFSSSLKAERTARKAYLTRGFAFIGQITEAIQPRNGQLLHDSADVPSRPHQTLAL
jgi:hypothetical protein